MTVKNIRKIFFELFFLNLLISFTMHDPNLKLKMCVNKIFVEGTVSQIFDRDPGLFFIKF